LTEADREAFNQQQVMQKYMSMGMESCVVKTAIAGAGGTKAKNYSSNT
jgi:hypothetical protein